MPPPFRKSSTTRRNAGLDSYMAIVDDIGRLRDDCLSRLDESHNYHAYTSGVWRVMQHVVRRGDRFTIRNQTTGDRVDETELSGLAQSYVTKYLASATFQHFVSFFERFIVNFLQRWLTEYPGSLSGNKLSFRSVLNAADKHEIVAIVVQKELHEITYKRVADWFGYLEKKAKLGCPNQDQIERLAEIKASRDVLVHNNGIANSVYIEKAMGRDRFSDGGSLELPEPYLSESWQLIKDVVTDVANAGIAKLES
jgi:hypothetical protein